MMNAFIGDVDRRNCSAAKIFPAITVVVSYYQLSALEDFARAEAPHSVSQSSTFSDLQSLPIFHVMS